MNQKHSLLILLICFCVSISFGQESSSNLKDKRISINMEKQPLGLVCRYLMENYDIPIGFERSTLDRLEPDFAFVTNLPAVGKVEAENADGSMETILQVEQVFEAKQNPITVNVENGSLEDVLNQIIKHMENYKWEINDEVVNIFPVKGRDERFEKLLGTNIKNFTFEKGKTVRDITRKIIRLPEIDKFLKDNKLYFTGVRAGAGFLLDAQYGRKLDVEMNFSNLTFKELLNKITKIKRGGWILMWKGISPTTGEEHIDINI